MRVEDLIEKLEELKSQHGNCYVVVEVNDEEEYGVDSVEVAPYYETKYFVIKG